MAGELKNSFPRAYVNEVPREGTAPGIEYVPFDNMEIGARKSGTRGADERGGPGAIEHVGKGR